MHICNIELPTIFLYSVFVALLSSTSNTQSNSRNGRFTILAHKEAWLYEEFPKVAYPDGKVLRIYTPEGKVLLDENENLGVGRPEQMKNRPEIVRVKVRDMLVDSLDEKTV